MEQKEIINWTVWYKQTKQQMPLQRFERDIASSSSAERTQLQKQIKGFGGRFKGKRLWFSLFNFYLLILSSFFILQSLFSLYQWVCSEKMPFCWGLNWKTKPDKSEVKTHLPLFLSSLLSGTKNIIFLVFESLTVVSSSAFWDTCILDACQNLLFPLATESMALPKPCRWGHVFNLIHKTLGR